MSKGKMPNSVVFKILTRTTRNNVQQEEHLTGDRERRRIDSNQTYKSTKVQLIFPDRYTHSAIIIYPCK